MEVESALWTEDAVSLEESRLKKAQIVIEVIGKCPRPEFLRLVSFSLEPETGDRFGFQGKRYETEKLRTRAFSDVFDDYLSFLEPRLLEAYRILSPEGTLYFHIDYREVHYCKMLLDVIFGRECFLNELVWAYDYGGRPSRKWPPKHDNILVYVKDPARYVFDREAVERIPYMAPGLVGPEKAARG